MSFYFSQSRKIHRSEICFFIISFRLGNSYISGFVYDARCQNICVTKVVTIFVFYLVLYCSYRWKDLGRKFVFVADITLLEKILLQFSSSLMINNFQTEVKYTIIWITIVLAGLQLHKCYIYINIAHRSLSIFVYKYR